MKRPISPRQEVARLGIYHAPIEGRAGALRLDFNEHTVGCSPAVRAALARLTRDAIATYPEYEATRRRLARFFRVAPAELLLTNGADDGLRLLIECFAGRGSEVVFTDPTFPMYRFYSELVGARIRALRYDENMRFLFRDLLRVLRRPPRNGRPRILLVANPNNPTGTLLSRADLKQILEVARNTLVVVDEAYAEFSGVTVLGWIRRYPHLVVTRTFSKASGLAGLRLGCVFTNRETAAALRRAQSPFPVSVPALVAAEAAIRDRSYVRQYVRQVLRARSELANFLVNKNVRVYPTAANFLLADFGSRAPALLKSLARQKILLRDRRSDFGRLGPVRITIGTLAQMRRLMRALEKLL